LSVELEFISWPACFGRGYFYVFSHYFKMVFKILQL